MANRPAPERQISTDLVHRLISDQAQELASLPLRELSRGWDNTNFRLGSDHLVRVPHREVAAPLVLSEQRWLPVLAPQLDMPIPAPTHIGRPTEFYPWPWSITPWFEGVEAAQAELTDPGQTAAALGGFFSQLHVPAPPDAPVNPYRGVPLEDRSAAFSKNLDLLRGLVDTDRIAAEFEAAAKASSSTARLWLHGDLHGRNMVVHEGQLAAVIDWGDICTGDRATDLAGAFMLVPDHLETVQRASATSDQDWQRARGWALHFAVVYLAHCDDDPVMHSVGTELLATLLGNA